MDRRISVDFTGGCLKNRDLCGFSDSLAEIGTKDFPEDSHWINAPIEGENDKTLLQLAIEGGLRSFVEVRYFQKLKTI